MYSFEKNTPGFCGVGNLHKAQHVVININIEEEMTLEELGTRPPT